MDREIWICEENIRNYRRQLEAERDEYQRRVLRELLAREEAKLRQLPSGAADDPSRASEN
jgi:hypothetical protein